MIIRIKLFATMSQIVESINRDLPHTPCVADAMRRLSSPHGLVTHAGHLERDENDLVNVIAKPALPAIHSNQL